MAAAARGVEHSVAPGTKNWFRCARRLGAVWRPSATRRRAVAIPGNCHPRPDHPGPVVWTVGIPGGLLAAAVALAPSFPFVTVGAPPFDLPPALALQHLWQIGVLAAAAVRRPALRLGVSSEPGPSALPRHLSAGRSPGRGREFKILCRPTLPIRMCRPGALVGS